MDIGRQGIVEGVAQLTWIVAGREVQVGDLGEGVEAGIGPARTHQFQRLAPVAALTAPSSSSATVRALRCACQPQRAPTRAKFAFIDAEKADSPVSTMCAVLDVSRAGFYSWRERPRVRTSSP